MQQPNIKQEVREFFNKESLRYQKEVLDVNLGSKYVNQRETDFVKSCTEDKKIKKMVDIGIGTARFSEMLLDKTDYLLGIDISEDMIDFSRKKLNSPKVNFLNADVEELDITNLRGEFDFLICMRVFKYFNKPKETIQKFSNLCAPGATLIVEYANSLSYLSLLKYLYTRVFKNNSDATYFNSLCLLSEKEIKAHYSSAGLRIKKIGYVTVLPYFIFAKINSPLFLKVALLFENILRIPFKRMFSRDIIVVAEKN